MSRLTSLLDDTNGVVFMASETLTKTTVVQIQRPYGCLSIEVGPDGKITLNALDGGGLILDEHEIDPDQFVHPPVDKEKHDLGNSGGG